MDNSRLEALIAAALRVLEQLEGIGGLVCNCPSDGHSVYGVDYAELRRAVDQYQEVT